MPNPIFIPPQVRKAITQHIKHAVARAKDAYFSANEDEDSLTGQLGGQLRIKEQTVLIDDIEMGGLWKWSIDYCKFRGRGKNATEKVLGADGILELEVARGRSKVRKASLFQAKNGWSGRDGLVLGQSLKLSTWREAAFVIGFEEKAINAYSLDDVVRHQGHRPATGAMPLDDFIADRFLECIVGDRELRYDAQRRRLQWRDAQGGIVSTAFAVGHRVRVDVEAPPGSGVEELVKLIDNDQVHNHRMQASAHDILGVGYDASPKEVKQRGAALAAIYHPDVLNSVVGELERTLATRRMQEINTARTELGAASRQRRRAK